MGLPAAGFLIGAQIARHFVILERTSAQNVDVWVRWGILIANRTEGRRRRSSMQPRSHSPVIAPTQVTGNKQPQEQMRIASGKRSAALDQLGDQRITRLLQLLPSGPAPTADDAARLTTLSRSRLQHLFRSETGQTLRAFLLGIRLKKAAAMLSSTDLEIKQIAGVAGYSHTSSFTRAFRRSFGLSPIEFRVNYAQC